MKMKQRREEVQGERGEGVKDGEKEEEDPDN